MNPSEMPSFDAPVDYQGGLQKSIAQTAPLATHWSGALSPYTTAPQVFNQVSPSKGSGLSKFFHFIGGVGGEIGHLAGGAFHWVTSNLTQAVEAPYKFGEAISHGWQDRMDINEINSLNQQYSDKMDSLGQLYKDGKITSKEYATEMKSISQDLQNLDRQSSGLDNRIKADQSTAIQAGINTAADVLTILTGGFGKSFSTEITSTGLEPIFAKTTADYLASTNANVFLSNVERGVAKLAANPEMFAELTPAAQKAIQSATAEVIAGAGSRMTAGQIARATAANIALKYPIYYNYLSGTGTELYHQLDNKKYGDAVRTVAFNAALALSGGPIGYALKRGGSLIGGTTARVFGRTSFLDELSKGIGNGTVSGLYDAVKKLPKEDQADAVKQLSAVEATNMSAVGGDPVAAAWRVLNGMSAYEGAAMDSFSHEEALSNMINFAKAQRLADETAHSVGLGAVTVGRVDARALEGISAELTKGDLPLGEGAIGKDVNGGGEKLYRGVRESALKQYGDKAVEGGTTVGASHWTTNAEEAQKYAGDNGKVYQIPKNKGEYYRSETSPGTTTPYDVYKVRTENLKSAQPIEVGKNVGATEQRLQVWESLKASNPTQAWANNENFDRQIKSILQRTNDPTEIDHSIRNITSSFFVKGFPKAAAKQLAKMGYIPITPVNLEAPFIEGTGKVLTKFAQDEDFFIRTVQPLPVLSSVGALLTHMGLSPTASTQRVYEVFNKNVAEGLANTRAFSSLKLMGDTDAQTSDYIIKKLSDYSHELSGRKFPIKAPITDLRQLTTNDVINALSVTRSEAREIKGAIMDSMIKVPLEIRGLGDRVMDLNYKVNPFSKSYARIQGALRFAWNPFFQVKLATKTEFLTQMEAGGKMPPLSGLASVFSGEYGKLDEIRGILRDGGYLEKSSGLGALGGAEAVADGSAVGANLTHKLLPVQEKSIAGLVATQAEKAGMSVEDFVKAFPGETRDTIQMIAGYDRRSALLNSPLIRTLNFAFFPLRFDIKVAQITAKALAKTSPMTQLAFIKGLYNGSNWLKSPEGQAWYSHNSEAIGLIKYFSPLTTFQTLAEALTGVSHGDLQETVGAFELGGLPFGWIPQLLDAEGLTNFNQSGYVNPKTGDIIPEYVPQTAKAQLQTAISDFLGSIFSYPGATVGLPSKTQVDAYIAASITGGRNLNDFNKVTPQITPEQQQFSNVVKQTAGIQDQPQPDFNQPTLTPTIKVPAEPTPITKRVPTPGSSGSKGRRLKKSQYKPYLLPGQSELGQL